MNKLAKAEIKVIDLEIDTEYTHVSDPVNHHDFYCRNITAQCREINQTRRCDSKRTKNNAGRIIRII